MAELARRIPVATLAESLNNPHDALGSVDPEDEAAVNVAALLFQTRDATAGLIGNTLLAPARGSVDDLVVHTNRLDPSVQLTTRFLRDPLDIAATTTPAGAHVVVLLAAANHDPATNGQIFTFGVGCRPCPGATHALALAAGVLDALTAFRPTATAVRYEPHPNLRIPATLTLRRCGREPSEGVTPARHTVVNDATTGAAATACVQSHASP